ncbi:MAG TPA: ferritin-like domain-containing protein [Acidimicrobiales bacterium]|nr:ferritin-like domain-containing protein [Acidimicrobiales bacterium]
MSARFDEQMEENQSLLERVAPSPLSRRKVLLGGGAGALALVAAACGGDDDDEPATTGDPDTSETTEGATGGGGDVETAMVAAGLELLAVNTYQAALDAAGSGALSDVPEAVATFITTAQGHHQAALDEWNALLSQLGEAEVTAVPEALSDLETTVNDAFAEAGDVVAVAELALTLEQTAADTYFDAIPGIENAEALALAASIQPIDMQHAAILHYVLGEYPVPDTFSNNENSALSA